MSGVWTELEIGGHPCYGYAPPTPSPHGYTIVYLHGVDQEKLADHPAFQQLFDQHGLRCLAPVTRRSWWLDRICHEFDPNITAERHVLDRVVPWLAEHWNVGPPRIALLGAGMGGQGALRLAYRRPNTFPVAAAISPIIDYHLIAEKDDVLRTMYRDAEQARQDTALLHIHPLNWPRHQWFCSDPADRWWESVDRLQMKLYSLGVPYESELNVSGGGHSWEYFERMAPAAIGFIADRLERERLRA